MNLFSRKSDPREGREERDPVWGLLEQSPLSEPDAWFAARTLARCRNAGATAEARAPILSRAWRWAMGTGLIVGVAMLMGAQVRHHTHHAALATAVPASKQKRVQEAFEIVASMAPDADVSANNLSWQDTSL